MSQVKIAVVIPAFKVAKHVLGVLGKIGSEVMRIYVIDDACPQHSGALVQEKCTDPRVKVLFHKVNQGVGGAVVSGYRTALAEGMDVVVKVDGDGQMDPTLIPAFIQPLLLGRADYVKGNRFFNFEYVRTMPRLRLWGNVGLSFMTKFSTGYWNIFDPTNGFTAITRGALAELPLERLSQRYFFESDMLFRLGLARCVVVDFAHRANYGEEVSSLQIKRVVLPFLLGNLRNFIQRIFYTYYLRDFSVASVCLPLGALAVTFGVVFGGVTWFQMGTQHQFASSGTVMLAALPIILGVQLLLTFLFLDILNVPKSTISGAAHT